jgi:hypothetical protein
MHNERRRGQRPGAAIKSLRCTTCGATGSSLGTIIKFLCAAAGIGLGTTIKYLVNQNAGAGNNLTKLGMNSEYIPCSVTLFVVNSKPLIGERPSVRLYVGPELARCVYYSLAEDNRQLVNKLYPEMWVTWIEFALYSNGMIQPKKLVPSPFPPPPAQVSEMGNSEKKTT